MPHWETLLPSAGNFDDYLASIVVKSRIYILSGEHRYPESNRENRATMLVLRRLDCSVSPYRLLEESEIPLQNQTARITWCFSSSCEDELHFLLRYYILPAGTPHDTIVTYHTVRRAWSRTRTSGSAPARGYSKGCQVGRAIFVRNYDEGENIEAETVYSLDLDTKQWSVRGVRAVEPDDDRRYIEVSRWKDFFVILTARRCSRYETFLTRGWEVSLFNTTNNTWLMPESSGTPPPESSLVQAATYGNKLIVFSKPLNDGYRSTPAICSFDFEQHIWSAVACIGLPSVENLFCWHWLPHNHHIYCFSQEISRWKSMIIQVLNMRSRPLTKQCMAGIRNNVQELRSLPSSLNIGDYSNLLKKTEIDG